MEANAPNFGNQGLNTEENEWNSRFLRSRAHRQKIEDNVNALRNRITFLENEEMKLLTKIEETKSRALDVIKIKRDSRLHNQMVSEHKVYENRVVSIKHHEASALKEDLDTGLKTAVEQNVRVQMSKADQVKQSLSLLKNQYSEHKKIEQRQNMTKVNMQRNFEAELEQKKAHILQVTKDAARTRYEAQIREEDGRAERYAQAIARLEQREQDMISKLKRTQTQHATFIEDLERINNNQDPTGPLASLRETTTVSGAKKWMISKNRVSHNKI